MSRVWTQQPQYPVSIDWGNPLTKGLKHCIGQFAGRWVDLVTGKLVAQSGSPSVVAEEDGLVRKTVSTSSQYGYINTSITGAPFTLFTRHKVNNGSSAEAVASFGTVSGTERAVIFYGAIAGSYSGSILPSLGGEPTLAAAVNVVNSVGFSLSANDNYSVLTLNGKSVAVQSVVCSLTNSFTRIYLSARMNATAGVFGNMSHTLTFAFNRVLSLAEQKSLSDNPWQILQPLPSRIFVGIPASGSPTLYPPLYTNTSELYSLTVTGTSSTQSVTANLLDNSGTAGAVYSPTVTRGAVLISPSLLDAGNSVYSPTVNTGSVLVSPAYFENPNSVYSPSVFTGASISPVLLENGNTIYVPNAAAGAVTVSPSIVTNDSAVYSPTVFNVGGGQTVSAAYFEDTNTIFNSGVGRFSLSDLDFLLYYMEGNLMLSTPEEVATAVMAALAANPNTLTVPKFLALK